MIRQIVDGIVRNADVIKGNGVRNVGIDDHAVVPVGQIGRRKIQRIIGNKIHRTGEFIGVADVIRFLVRFEEIVRKRISLCNGGGGQGKRQPVRVGSVDIRHEFPVDAYAIGVTYRKMNGRRGRIVERIARRRRTVPFRLVGIKQFVHRKREQFVRGKTYSVVVRNNVGGEKTVRIRHVGCRSDVRTVNGQTVNEGNVITRFDKGAVGRRRIGQTVVDRHIFRFSDQNARIDRRTGREGGSFGRVEVGRKVVRHVERTAGRRIGKCYDRDGIVVVGCKVAHPTACGSSHPRSGGRRGEDVAVFHDGRNCFPDDRTGVFLRRNGGVIHRQIMDIGVDGVTEQTGVVVGTDGQTAYRVSVPVEIAVERALERIVVVIVFIDVIRRGMGRIVAGRIVAVVNVMEVLAEIRPIGLKFVCHGGGKDDVVGIDKDSDRLAFRSDGNERHVRHGNIRCEDIRTSGEERTVRRTYVAAVDQLGKKDKIGCGRDLIRG